MSAAIAPAVIVPVVMVAILIREIDIPIRPSQTQPANSRTLSVSDVLFAQHMP